MRYPCFDPAKVEKYLLTECYLKDDDIFKASHISMSFKLREPREQVPETGVEGEILAIICSGWPGVLSMRDQEATLVPNAGVQVVLVAGDTGTGKTELCRFVEYSLKHRDYFSDQMKKSGVRDKELLNEFENKRQKVDCIRVERGNISALGVTAIPIAVKYKGEDLAKPIANFIDLIKDSFYPVLKMRFETQQKMYAEMIPRIGELLASREVFEEAISRNLDQHKKEIEGVEINRGGALSGLQLIRADDTRTFGIEISAKELEEINGKLLEELAQIIMPVGIQAALKQYIKNANEEGLYPVIILDDISLLNRSNLTMILDFLTGIAGERLNGTIMVGITTGVFAEQIQNIRSNTLAPRVYEIHLSSKDKVAEWLTPDKCISFVERYLELIRNQSCPGKCGAPHRAIEVDNHDLYPMNVRFLARLSPYLESTEFGRTPRGFVSALYTMITSTSPAYDAIDAFLKHQGIGNYDPLVGFSEEARNKLDKVALVAFWYGKVTVKSYAVEKRIVDAWDIKTELETHENLVEVPLSFTIAREEPVLEEAGQEQEQDSLRFVDTMVRIQRWHAGEVRTLDAKAEILVQEMFRGCVSAVLGEATDKMSRVYLDSTYTPTRTIAWSPGADLRVVITKFPEQIKESSPLVILTDITPKERRYPTMVLSMDDFKVLVEDAIKGEKYSKRFVYQRYWELRQLAAEYKRFLSDSLNDQLKAPVTQVLASTSLILFSAMKGEKLASKKGEMLSGLKQFLAADFTKLPTGDLSMLGISESDALSLANLLKEILRSLVLFRLSVVNVLILGESTPSLDQVVKVASTPRRVSEYWVVIDEKGKTVERLSDVLARSQALAASITKASIDLQGARVLLAKWQGLSARYTQELPNELADLKKKFGALRATGVNVRSALLYHESPVSSLITSFPDAAQFSNLATLLTDLGNLLVSEGGASDAFLIKLKMEQCRRSPALPFLEALENELSDLTQEMKRTNDYADAVSRAKVSWNRLIALRERFETP